MRRLRKYGGRLGQHVGKHTLTDEEVRQVNALVTLGWSWDKAVMYVDPVPPGLIWEMAVKAVDGRMVRQDFR